MDNIGASVLRGTCVKFEPPTGFDTMMLGGVSTRVATRQQCITMMNEYELKSLEELRLEDYYLNHLFKKKAPTGAMHSANATSQEGILPSTFSFPTSTSAVATAKRSVGDVDKVRKPSISRAIKPAIAQALVELKSIISKLTFSDISQTTTDLSRRIQLFQPLSTEQMMGQWDLNFKTFQKMGSAAVDASTQAEGELHDRKLFQGLKEMLQTSKYSDFVLNVRGQEFKVHKMILDSHSPVFAAMMKHDTKEKATGVVHIDDCEPLTMINFLEFLYTLKVDNLNSDNVIDLYEVADKYQVTELSDLCIEYMINNISIENFCDILTFSLRYHIGNLTAVATQFFLRNSKEIAVTVKWGTFLAENPVAGNELFLKALSLKK